MSVKDLTTFRIFAGYTGEPVEEHKEFSGYITLHLVDAREAAHEILDGEYTPVGYNPPDFVRIFCQGELIEEVHYIEEAE